MPHQPAPAHRDKYRTAATALAALQGRLKITRSQLHDAIEQAAYTGDVPSYARRESRKLVELVDIVIPKSATVATVAQYIDHLNEALLEFPATPPALVTSTPHDALDTDDNM
jgi:hypothetical protein